MSKLEVFWKGRIHLDRVTWQLNPDSNLILSPELEAERDEVWKRTLREHPNSYDGNLVVLLDYEISESSANFKLGSITFSRILTLEQAGIGPDAYGSLGFQSIIYSSDREYVVVGERAKESLYCPLYHAIPGGMLEVSDTKGSFEQACMREIGEEADIELEQEKYLVALIDEVHGSVGIIAMIEAIAKGPIDYDAPISGNEEWTDRLLQWISIEELSQFTIENSLEGPVFLKNDLCESL
jgi:ADP-ribose pyrophosphatase YjhB (NUDIX family)